MTRLTARLVLCSTILGACGVDTPTTTAIAEAVDGTWSSVPTPGVGVAGSPAEFWAAAANSSTDAWAFGQQPVVNKGGSTLPLVERWNGTAWSIATTPTLTGSVVATLQAGAAVASSNVWAVGYETTTTNTWGAGLIERWDGQSWKLSTHPNPGIGSRLYAVSAAASNSVWAVGEEFLSAGGQSETLVLNYNGSTWKAMTPYVGTKYSTLYAVKAISASDVWALGSDFNTPIALHWNGSSWKSYPFPIQTNPPTDASFAQSIDGAASNDIWALGHNLQPAGYEGGEASYAQAWHWDGTQWSIVTINSEISSTSSFFSGVTTLASDDIWALGMAGGFYAGQQIVLHYDGSAWTMVSSPATGNYFPGYNALAASPNGDVWAVGTTDYTFATFAMHYTE